MNAQLQPISERANGSRPVDCYVVRADHEWAIFYLDNALGTFQCQSSFGNYAYIWRSIGGAKLQEFLTDLDFDYFMKKTRPDFRRFDFDASVESMKEQILRYRREGGEKKFARAAWDELHEIEYSQSQDIFLDHVYRSSGLYDVLGSEFYEFACVEPDGNSRGFWERIWPEFLKQIAPTTAVPSEDRG